MAGFTKIANRHLSASQCGGTANRQFLLISSAFRFLISNFSFLTSPEQGWPSHKFLPFTFLSSTQASKVSQSGIAF